MEGCVKKLLTATVVVVSMTASLLAATAFAQRGVPVRIDVQAVSLQPDARDTVSGRLVSNKRRCSRFRFMELLVRQQNGDFQEADVALSSSKSAFALRANLEGRRARIVAPRFRTFTLDPGGNLRTGLVCARQVERVRLGP